MALRTLKVQQIWNHLATLRFVLSIELQLAQADRNVYFNALFDGWRRMEPIRCEKQNKHTLNKVFFFPLKFSKVHLNVTTHYHNEN